MERTLRLSPRQQLFLDLVRQVPAADIAAVETYLYFARVASDIFANQQAFFGRYELSEGKLVVLQLLRQATHYRTGGLRLQSQNISQTRFWGEAV